MASRTLAVLMGVAVVLSLYPVCAWYGELKARSRARWMSYL